MKCPVCKTKPCTPIELEQGLPAASCEGCGGHWLSRQHYMTWLERHGDTLPEKPFSDIEFDVNDVNDAKLCPDCTRVLLKFKVGHGLNFSVDHCPGCGGIWLDTNEWHALQDKNLHDEIHKMFSTAWQARVRGEHMAASLELVYANRFGSEAYAKACEIRRWLDDTPQKQAILSFLAEDDPYKV
jgi:Zn-finger nucleic acid-binding protein